MRKYLKITLRVIFLFFVTAIPCFSQEKGEIIISPQPLRKETVKEARDTLKKENQNQAVSQDRQAEDFGKLKNYKRKIYIIYIVLFICLLYLLITFRNRKRRL